MLNFIVLGIVPGTSVQITFWAFLLGAVLLAMPFLFLVLFHTQSGREQVEKSAAKKQNAIEMIAL